VSKKPGPLQKTLTIPYNFQPRPYQLPFLKSSNRFRIAIWHRRSGKSKTALNDQIARLHLKPGIYYYVLPTYKQAKAVIWDALIKEHVPFELVEKINESELAIYWKNGSIQRFVGCEDPQKHRGINPIDVVFDEFSEMREEIWTEIIQPVLRENGGRATFIFTFRGRNHAWRLYQQAKDNPQWFVQVLRPSRMSSIAPRVIVRIWNGRPRAWCAGPNPSARTRRDCSSGS
jgi:phage terminase large subunit